MTVSNAIRVLDLGRCIAGPLWGALLADYGADVIRVDRVGGTDDRFILPASSEGAGAQFLQVDRNKRSISLEIDTSQGREVLNDVVVGADVVIAKPRHKLPVQLTLRGASVSQMVL